MFKNKGLPTFMFVNTHSMQHNIISISPTIIKIFDYPISTIKLGHNILYDTPFCLQRAWWMVCSSLWLVFCIMQCNGAPKCHNLLPYPSPWVCGGVHEAPTTLPSSFRLNYVLVRPPPCSIDIFSPCWHCGIKPKKYQQRDGDAIGSSVIEARMPIMGLSNARSRAYFKFSGRWWESGLGGLGCPILGMLFS